MGPHSIFWNTKKCGWPYEENGCMAPKLSGGPILVKIPNIYCAIYDLTSNEVLMTQKVRKTKFFQWKNGCMTPQLLGGPFLIQIYNIEPFLARAIKTTKVNTVPYHSATFYWDMNGAKAVSLRDPTMTRFHALLGCCQLYSRSRMFIYFVISL